MSLKVSTQDMYRTHSGLDAIYDSLKLLALELYSQLEVFQVEFVEFRISPVATGQFGICLCLTSYTFSDACLQSSSSKQALIRSAL